MRRILAVIAAFAGLGGSAAAAVPGPWEQHVANVVALRYWHQLPPCGHPRIVYDSVPSVGADVEPPSITGPSTPPMGWTRFDCAIHLNRRYHWTPETVCDVTLHEWGHLVLGPEYFAAINPSDPAHSPDPRNVMYPYLRFMKVCDWQDHPSYGLA